MTSQERQYMIKTKRIVGTSGRKVSEITKDLLSKSAKYGRKGLLVTLMNITPAKFMRENDPAAQVINPQSPAYKSYSPPTNTNDTYNFYQRDNPSNN